MRRIKARDRCKAVIIDHEILKIWSVSVKNIIEIQVKRKLFTEKWKWQLFCDECLLPKGNCFPHKKKLFTVRKF